MAKPVLIINGHDYAKYVESLEITKNDLDAEGSGRDVQTGLMYRTRIATKLKAQIKMLRLQQPIMQQLSSDLSGVFLNITLLHPDTGTAVTRSYYTSSVPFGAQRYNRETGAPYYDGVTFSITER